MAAGEDQPQPVVGHGVADVVDRGRRRPRHRGHLPQLRRLDRRAGAAGRAARLRAVVVSQAPGRRGTPSRGQRSQRLGERVLRALLGQVPVAGEPDQRGDDRGPTRRRNAACDRRSRRRSRRPRTGRISISPTRAIGCFAATSIASSRSAHSTMSNPRHLSFVSTNGPSVSSTSPSRTRTVVASLAGRMRLADQAYAAAVHLVDPRVQHGCRMAQAGRPAGCRVAPSAQVDADRRQVFIRPPGWGVCTLGAGASRPLDGRDPRITTDLGQRKCQPAGELDSALTGTAEAGQPAPTQQVSCRKTAEPGHDHDVPDTGRRCARGSQDGVANASPGSCTRQG